MAARPVDIDALYRRHQEDLLRYFTRRTADAEAAVDLWAETFAQAVRARWKCRGITADEQAAWLYGIARNQLMLFLRRGYAEQRAMQRLGIERPVVSDAFLREVERRAGLGEVRTAIAGALSTLGDDMRRAVELRVVDELPYAEVAARLSITEIAARARVSRGLQRLSGLLDPDLLHEVTA